MTLISFFVCFVKESMLGMPRIFFFDKAKNDFNLTAKTYSILMRGWADIGDLGKARKLFDELLERGCLVDLLAYNSILESLFNVGNMN